MGKGFLEIAPRKSAVTIKSDGGEVSIELRPLSMTDLAAIALRFAPFKKLMDGDGLKAGDLLAHGGELVGAIIAAALDKPGDAEHEAKAATLPLADQFAIVKRVYEISFPPEVRGPFDKMLAMAVEGFNTNLDAAASQPALSSDSSEPNKS